jgi:hypothetical protein
LGRKHARYLPNIAEKVAHLSLDDVRDLTRAAYKIYGEDAKDLKKATGIMTKLQGVTLPTATLVMSVFDPKGVPYFCDDLYRYLHVPERERGDYDGKVHYTQKEYASLCDKVLEVQNRIKEQENKEVTAQDLEKVAHCKVMGHQSAKERGAGGVEKRILPPSPKLRETKRQKKTNERLDCFKHLHECFDKGRNGSPTLDEAGYELDYDKVADWMKPSYVRKPNWKKEEAYFDRKKQEFNRKSELMDGQGKDQVGIEEAWHEKVLKDLGKKHWTLSMEDWEDWYKKGFRAKPGEFDNFSQAEMDRRLKLMTGASLRK